MRILIATDAWKPQVNGVVNTYSNIEREAANAGLDLTFLTPSGFRTLPLPTYSEIRLADDPPCATSQGASRKIARISFTSQPRGRSGLQRALTAGTPDGGSRQAITPGFRNM